MRRLLLAVVLASAAIPAAATAQTRPSPASSEPVLEIETALDPTATEDARAMQRRPFTPSPTHVISYPLTTGVMWLRLRLRAPSAMSRLLTVTLPYIDRAELFTAGPSPLRIGLAGRAVPLGETTYPARLVAFPIELDGQRQQTFLLRLEAKDVKLAPIEILTETTFQEREANHLLIHGLYLGVAGAMILYNLFLLAGLRDHTYLYYTLFGASIAALAITESGYLGFYGGPLLRSLAPRLIALLTATAGIFGLLFARAFLDVTTWSITYSRLYVFLTVAFGVALAQASLTSQPTALPGILLTAPLLVLNFWVGVHALLRRHRSARLFMLAFTAFLLGLSAWLSLSFGLVGPNAVTIHGYKLGSAMEMILLSLALADRINVLRNEREEARREALAALERSRDELEGRVAARTAELSRTNETLQKALDDNRVLLREVHHRVKNNMQVMLSLLRPRGGSRGKSTEEVLADARDRIKVISSIHSRFCESNDLSHIDLSAFVKSVTEGLARSLGNNRTKIQFDLTPVQLDLDRAMSCGLIVNELVTNALKHAPRRPLRVRLSFDRGAIELIVEDSGPASLSPSLEGLKPSGSFGLTIVRDLAEKKLHGSFCLEQKDDGPGARATVRFPHDTVVEQIQKNETRQRPT